MLFHNIDQRVGGNDQRFFQNHHARNAPAVLPGVDAGRNNDQQLPHNNHAERDAPAGHQGVDVGRNNANHPPADAGNGGFVFQQDVQPIRGRNNQAVNQDFQERRNGLGNPQNAAVHAHAPNVNQAGR